MNNDPSIQITYNREGAVTYAEAFPAEGTIAFEQRMSGKGKATLNPSDVDIPEVGEGIAAARAVQDLARELEEYYNSKTMRAADFLADLNALFDEIMGSTVDASLPTMTKREMLPGRGSDCLMFVNTTAGFAPIAVTPGDAKVLLKTFQNLGLEVMVGVAN